MYVPTVICSSVHTILRSISASEARLKLAMWQSDSKSICLQKKPVRTCAKSTVAAVYINSRITLRTPTHVDRMVLAQPSVHKERKLGAWHSNSRSMGLLHITLGSRSHSAPTFASTAMIFNSSSRARAMYTRNTCCKPTQ